MPEEGAATGHGEIAERAAANVVARRLGQLADEETVETAAALLAEHEAGVEPDPLEPLGAHAQAQVAALAEPMRKNEYGQYLLSLLGPKGAVS